MNHFVSVRKLGVFKVAVYEIFVEICKFKIFGPTWHTGGAIMNQLFSNSETECFRDGWTRSIRLKLKIIKIAGKKWLVSVEIYLILFEISSFHKTLFYSREWMNDSIWIFWASGVEQWIWANHLLIFHELPEVELRKRVLASKSHRNTSRKGRRWERQRNLDERDGLALSFWISLKGVS